MTPDERQAIREKHFFWKDKECNWDGEPYPCDVIKVLDALESTNGLVSPAQTDTCTHYGIDSGGADYYGTSNPPQEADWNYAYCPNCGVKL